MLTVTLRGLERDGLVRRAMYPEVPPRVEYALTPLGATLRDIVRELIDWSGTTPRGGRPRAGALRRAREAAELGDERGKRVARLTSMLGEPHD